MTESNRAYPPDRVTLREVGLRDGLQLVSAYPSTEAKAEWLRREADAGVRHFEIGSFLPAERMPQFADVRDVIAICEDLDVHSAALVMNERGLTDALSTPVGELVTVVSATEEHSQANMRRSRDAAIGLVRKTADHAAGAMTRRLVHVGISMAFGCSIAGPVEPDEVLRLSVACADAGADLIGLADTVGYAGPDQVADLVRRVSDAVSPIPVSIHLHDTRGMGIANASAALDAGARILDGSLGGLGGCPFAPGATGNVVFEDLVFLCERKGFPTGIDLNRLIGIREIAKREMPGESLSGALAQARTPDALAWAAH